MKISASINETGKYSLKLISGHFTGELDEISKESLVELRDSINHLIESSKENASITWQWNPRSGRHEKVEKKDD